MHYPNVFINMEGVRCRSHTKMNMDQVNIIAYLCAQCKCLSIAHMNSVCHSVIVCF